MSGRYTLNDDGQPVPSYDLLEWGRWMEKALDRRVALDTIGDVEVSTVFLGLDHSFGGATPILFETMIFGGKHDGYEERYATRDEAVEGHAVAVDMVRRS